MRTIKSGMECKKKNKNETMQVICKHCNAILEINARDVHSDFTLLGIKYYFNCPHCEEATRVKLKNMTENFKYWVLVRNSEF